jgi:hypothetical protein
MKLKRERQLEELALGDAVTALLEECRMLLPGLEALFGFQLIAVFSSGFDAKLSTGEQDMHLAAIACVALAAALVIGPAAYHRQTAPRNASRGFITVASWLLLLAMIPFMIGIGLDFYLIARVILQDVTLSVLLALLLVAVFAGIWFVLPRVPALQDKTGTDH